MHNLYIIFYGGFYKTVGAKVQMVSSILISFCFFGWEGGGGVIV